jgi:two-component system OmpR family response regulator
MRVLLVEDEPGLARTLRRTIEEEGFACDWAAAGTDALHRATHIEYDVIVLDLMLPEIDGWTILETLRGQGHATPVLVLTARDALADRVRGLDLGADDYLTKPFALEELLARVRALVRRAAAKPYPVLEIGDIRIDTVARTVARGKQMVPLAAKEYALLELLALRRGGILTRSEIYEHLYDDDAQSFSNVLDVYVASLRRKLGRELIETRRGLGYRIP